MKIKIVWLTPEMGNFTDGISNHNRLFIEYLRNQADVKEISVVKYPLPEDGIMPPLKEVIQGVIYFTPRISMDYHDAFKSILQADLKFLERLKIRLFKLALKFKRIKRFDSEQIKKWGIIEHGLFGFCSVQQPFPNPFMDQMGRFIAKIRPDIIQSHTEIISIPGGLAKKMIEDTVKAHISYQVLVEEEKEYFPPRTITRVFWERMQDSMQWLIEQQAVDMYVAASKFVETRLQSHGVKSEQIKVINSPIVLKQLHPITKAEARSKLGIPREKKVILSVGRLLERKRFIDIIDILKNLPENVLFYLKRSKSASDDLLSNTLGQLQKGIRKHKLDRRVIINSEILPYEQMHQIYSAADVVVLPFLHEPFGMCAAEAMATKRPLIVYNSGYLPQFIDGNGFVVEPMDLDALQEKILTLLNDPALADETGAKGPDLVKQYDIQVLGEKLLDIYREYL